MRKLAWILVLLPLASFPLAPTYFVSSRRGSVERPESHALKQIASAQAEHYAAHGWFVRTGLGGLDLESALLDADFDAPRRPWRGCWFRSIRHEDEAPDHLLPHRFAVLAFPADPPRSGRSMSAVEEGRTIWKSIETPRGGIDVLPLDAIRRIRWSKCD